MVSPLPPQLDQGWQNALKEEWSKPYLLELGKFLAIESKGSVPIYPSKENVFTAFSATPIDKVKVVIVGQDPYHGPNQAHGLCFSVPRGVDIPPSLRNIHKEINEDLGIEPPEHGLLTGWAEQGVLLLNSVLTVRARQAASHAKKGWEKFTDAVVEQLFIREDPIVFALWGKYAIDKCTSLASNRRGPHVILKAAHPSPLSAHRGFFGCRHFSKINQELTRLGKGTIDWSRYESRN
jgi:uracil-DNA glycosylase